MNAANDIQGHMDHELTWIISETVSSLFRNTETVQRRVICARVGNAVGQTLLGRLGDRAKTAKFTVEEFEKLAVDSISSMGEEILSKGSDRIAFFAGEACLVYAQARLMGLKSPYNPVPKNPYDDFWPFGQEGGFCNPMKLQLLQDD